MRGSCSCSSHSLRRRGQPGRLALLRKPLDHVQQEDFLDLVAVRVELPVERRDRVGGGGPPTAGESTPGGKGGPPAPGGDQIGKAAGRGKGVDLRGGRII